VNPARVTAVIVLFGLVYGAICLLTYSADHMACQGATADVIRVTRAQATYASFNGSFHEGNLACLERAGTCIPAAQAKWGGQATAGVSAGGPSLVARTKPELGRWFVAGPPADPTRIADGRLSPTSVQGFAYIASVPPGRPWWARLTPFTPPPAGYCGDGSDLVCALRTLPLPDYVEARCPADCLP
jgi:hypothetical protein